MNKSELKLYRLKHKKSGLYYTKNTLSEKGKIYSSPGNYLTYLGDTYDDLYIPRDGKLAQKYPILAELDCTTAEEFEHSVWTPSIRLRVTKDDFKKEYIN